MVIREALEHAATRLIIVRGLAAKWHTLPPDLTGSHGGGGAAAKPNPKAPPAATSASSAPRMWPYAEWDDVAPTMQPASTEVRAPFFFLDALYEAPSLPLPEDDVAAAVGAGGVSVSNEKPHTFILDTAALRASRDALVKSLNMLKLGVPFIAAEVDSVARAAAGALLPSRQLDKHAAVSIMFDFSKATEMAARVAELRSLAASNARAIARQAADAAAKLAAANTVSTSATTSNADGDSEVETDHNNDETDENDDIMINNGAAVHIQRIARGFVARCKAERERIAEAEFLGQRLSAIATQKLANFEAAAGFMVARLESERLAGPEALNKALGALPAGAALHGLNGAGGGGGG